MNADEKAQPSLVRAQTEPHPSGAGGSLHGKRSSWILVATVLIGFLCGAAGLIFQIWWLFWVAVAVVVLAVPAGKLIGIMDDTIAWTRPPSLDLPTGRILHSSDQPSHEHNRLPSHEGTQPASDEAQLTSGENVQLQKNSPRGAEG